MPENNPTSISKVKLPKIRMLMSIFYDPEKEELDVDWGSGQVLEEIYKKGRFIQIIKLFHVLLGEVLKQYIKWEGAKRIVTPN